MNRASKHAERTSAARVSKGVWGILAILLLAVWLPTFSFVAWRTWRESRADVLQRVDLNAGHNFIFDVTKLNPQEALWFTYPVDSERVRLAVQKDSAGKIRTVVASCKACYSFRNTHKFKDGELVCGRCRHVMRLGEPDEELTPAKGCVAVPVPSSTDGRLLTVRATDMEKQIRDIQLTNPSRK